MEFSSTSERFKNFSGSVWSRLSSRSRLRPPPRSVHPSACRSSKTRYLIKLGERKLYARNVHSAATVAECSRHASLPPSRRCRRRRPFVRPLPPLASHVPLFIHPALKSLRSPHSSVQLQLLGLGTRICDRGRADRLTQIMARHSTEWELFQASVKVAAAVAVAPSARFVPA